MARVPRDVVARLYAGPLAEFVARRNKAVAAARRAGDAATARAIAALRKPTRAAWMVNLLALQRPERVAELTALSAALRTAQRRLHGGQLRELSARRRAVISALVAEAQALARATDPALAARSLPLAEVEATLTAALADEEVAAQVRSGRLVRAVAYSGFGEVPRPRLRLIVGGAADEPAADAPTRRRSARKAADVRDRGRRAQSQE